jgi:Fe(II)/alpha-ketoglutarate-dependent arginine beta-hydroxylase
MLELTLTPQESLDIRGWLDSLSAEYRTVESLDFLLKATPLSHKLPRRLREAANDFRLRDDDDGILAIRGFPIDDSKIGRTPATWDDPSAPSRTTEEEMLLALCGTLLGELVSWASEQDGHVVHNVLPIREHEKTQLGWGSDIELIFHVEEAFSPYCPDYLGLMCMRNPAHVGTSVSAVADLDLGSLDLDILFSDKFVVRPDAAHLEETYKDKGHNSDRDIATSKRNDEIRHPKHIAVLFGDREAPYIRLDPPYMESDGSPGAKEALDGLVRQLSANKTHVRLGPGDIMFVDNFRVVHGREPFKAKYDGTDRWLKRIKVTRDLRKSREHRSSAVSRKIL